MKITVCEDNQNLTVTAGQFIVKVLNKLASPLLCFAAGETPIGVLNYLVKACRKGTINVDQAEFVGLDEWIGMNGDDPGSCRYTLDQNFFSPLNIKNSRIHFFDGKARDLKEESERINRFLVQRGPIDFILLGIGLNGHIGFNEPGSSLDSLSRSVELQEITQNAGKKYFNREQNLSQGLTLGLKQIIEAKQIVLLASGLKKAPIVKKLLKDESPQKIPAAFLKNNPNFQLFLDQAAYSKV